MAGTDGRKLKSDSDSMMTFSDIPGIIEGAMTITPEPDGRISFRVHIGAHGKRTDYCNRIELIIDPEHVREALAPPKIRRLDGAQLVDELPTFPCHIGFKPQ